MTQLSGCMFEWDPEDVDQLVRAKEQQLIESDVYRTSSKEDVTKHITKKELATHCKRRTRGSEATAELIQQLITTFSSDLGNDTMGIPLLDKGRAWQIWDEQKMHLDCIQDPAGVQLYTKTDTLKKSGVEVPVYRCTLGSLSKRRFWQHGRHEVKKQNYDWLKTRSLFPVNVSNCQIYSR